MRTKKMGARRTLAGDKAAKKGDRAAVPRNLGGRFIRTKLKLIPPPPPPTGITADASARLLPLESLKKLARAIPCELVDLEPWRDVLAATVRYARRRPSERALSVTQDRALLEEISSLLRAASAKITQMERSGIPEVTSGYFLFRATLEETYCGADDLQLDLSFKKAAETLSVLDRVAAAARLAASRLGQDATFSVETSDGYKPVATIPARKPPERGRPKGKHFDETIQKLAVIFETATGYPLRAGDVPFSRFAAVFLKIAYSTAFSTDLVVAALRRVRPG